VGLEVEGLDELAHQVAARCRAVGLAGDEKKFRAHITIGRVRQGRRVRLDPESLPQVDPLNFSLGGFSLVASTLTPQGPIYRELAAFSLAGGER
jgi:2'-5' RNA ligase